SHRFGNKPSCTDMVLSGGAVMTTVVNNTVSMSHRLWSVRATGYDPALAYWCCAVGSFVKGVLWPSPKLHEKVSIFGSRPVALKFVESPRQKPLAAIVGPCIGVEIF